MFLMIWIEISFDILNWKLFWHFELKLFLMMNYVYNFGILVIWNLSKLVLNNFQRISGKILNFCLFEIVLKLFLFSVIYQNVVKMSKTTISTVRKSTNYQNIVKMLMISAMIQRLVQKPSCESQKTSNELTKIVNKVQ